MLEKLKEKQKKLDEEKKKQAEEEKIKKDLIETRKKIIDVLDSDEDSGSEVIPDKSKKSKARI